MSSTLAAIDPSAIRDHYDRLSPLYQRFWGEHIHHGLWRRGDESLQEAQENLVAHLAQAADIRPRSRVLDVGCGLGGSSVWLAREYDCTVEGLTLSPVQVSMAIERAHAAGVAHRVYFRVRDANQLDIRSSSYQVVWSIECTEHLVDKARFMAEAAAALTPGGVVAICAWLADPKTAAHREQVEDVCRGMLCPSLASADDYRRWMEQAGLRVVRVEDLTREVERTWERAQQILERSEVRAILAVSPRAVQAFARSFTSIRQAYAEGAMSYGLFVASKDDAGPAPAVPSAEEMPL